MRITKKNLKSLIKNILTEAEWDEQTIDAVYKPSNMEPSDKLYKKLMGAEGHVPYVYDDKRKENAKKVPSKDLEKIVAAGRSPKSGAIPKRLASYSESKGTPTIGIGHAIFQKGHKKYDPKEQEKYKPYLKGGDSYMTKSEAIKLFKADVVKHAQFKDRIEAPISQNMFDSLVSLAFNSGWERGKPIDRIISLINKKQYKKAAKKILSTAVKSKGEVLKGLQRRRKKEYKMFLADYSSFISDLKSAGIENIA